MKYIKIAGEIKKLFNYSNFFVRNYDQSVVGECAVCKEQVYIGRGWFI